MTLLEDTSEYEPENAAVDDKRCDGENDFVHGSIKQNRANTMLKLMRIGTTKARRR